MSGGTHIRAIGTDDAPSAQDETFVSNGDEPIMLEEEWVEEDFSEEPPRPWNDWLIPTIASLAILAWSGFFGWAFRADILAGGTPTQWVSWIINWSVPVLLIGVFWLLAMRNSRREAARFGDAASLLARESANLEQRLAVVNRELSLAREFLGAQTRELESFGRIASDRLSARAGELQQLIHNNGEQVNAIASVSDTALINMSKLRDDLPVIANSARDVSNHIGNAGRTAHEQLEKLVAGFDRLNEFGQASGRHVNALSEQIEQTLTSFEDRLDQVERVTESRFNALAEKGEAFRVELDGREVDALAAMRHRADELRNALGALSEEFAAREAAHIDAVQSRIETLSEEGEALGTALRAAERDALGQMRRTSDEITSNLERATEKMAELDTQAHDSVKQRLAALELEIAGFADRQAARDARFNEEIARRQDEFETRETQASELLAERLSQLDELVSERNEAQAAQLNRLIEHGTQISDRAEALEKLITAVSLQAEDARGSLSQGLGEFSTELNKSRTQLTETGRTLGELTESGIRLLEIIQSGAKESSETLPAAIEQAGGMLSDVEQRVMMLKDTVDAAHTRSSELSNYVIASRENIVNAGEQVSALHQKLSEESELGIERIASLRNALSELEQDSERVSARTSEELRASIVQLEEAATHAFVAIESGSNERLEMLAKEISAKASEAIERSLRVEGLSAAERIEEATSRATGAGKETAIALRDQLAKVTDLAVNLEQRVARAREQAQEQVDNDFARRMALITESLNSHSIDIAQAMSQEVTDTAWAAYLKGDRGIFTRRAVRLLDSSAQREIVDLFERDDSFREHVSRYIHDFEGMLRTVLSTRDGNALGVTLLSSDMGKLYVALAHSIERLRD